MPTDVPYDQLMSWSYRRLDLYRFYWSSCGVDVIKKIKPMHKCYGASIHVHLKSKRSFRVYVPNNDYIDLSELKKLEGKTIITPWDETYIDGEMVMFTSPTGKDISHKLYLPGLQRLGLRIKKPVTDTVQPYEMENLIWHFLHNNQWYSVVDNQPARAWAWFARQFPGVKPTQVELRDA